MEKPTTIDNMREVEIEIDGATSSPSLSHSQEMALSDRELKNADPSDMKNPRNWSRTRKTLLFVSLMGSSLLADG
jgi:hypothetical protein